MTNIIFEESLDGISIDRIMRDYEYTMSTKHVHNEHEIYYLLEGERYYFIEKQTYHIKKGSLVFIDRGQIHKTGAAGSSYHDRILITLREEQFTPFFALSNELNLQQFFSKNNGVLELDEEGQRHIETLLFGIASEIHEKAVGYRISVMMKLAELLIFSNRLLLANTASLPLSASNTPKHKKVDEVASFIAMNCEKAQSLNTLARQFYVSKSYLSRIFKEVTGFTVNEYINIFRIKKAQSLLIDSTMNITEISQALGYESITYFEKVFKKYTETSPLKYRRQHRNPSL